MAIRAILDINFGGRGLTPIVQAENSAPYVQAASISVPYVEAIVQTLANSKNRFLNDGLLASEIVIFASVKGVRESASASDAYGSEFGKYLIESFALADSSYLGFGKLVSDEAAITEERFERDISKGLQDIASVTEQFVSATQYQRIASDVAAVQDAYSASVSYARAFDDPLTITEVFSIASLFRQSLDDLATVADELSKSVAFVRHFSESVYATDDLDGEASLLDDQEMLFVKQRTEFTKALDYAQIVVAYVRKFSELASISDEVRSDLAKQLSDSGYMTDEQSMLLVRALSDAGFITDVAHTSFDKASDDPAKMSDSHFATLDKAIALDPLSLSDLPAKGVHRGLSDASEVSDEQSTQYGKQTADSATIGDQLEPFQLGKGLDEPVPVLDNLGFNLTRSFTDSIVLSDLVVDAAIFENRYQEVFGMSDRIEKIDLAAKRFDTALIGESLARAIAYIRAFEDAYSATDLSTVSFGKSFGEPIGISDLFEITKGFNRAPNDLISCVESMSSAYGKFIAEATLTADVFARVSQFVREFVESASIADDQSIDIAKLVNDGSQLADSYVAEVSFVRSPQESTSVNDVALAIIGKTLSDSVSGVGDLFSSSVAYSRSLLDAFAVSDSASVSVAYQRPKTDAVGLSDQANQAWQYNRAHSETFSISDAFASVRAFQRSLSDAINATDDIDGEASLLDEQVMQFIKSRNDFVGTTDLTAIGVVKARTDALFTADAGSVLSQGYTDNMTYFSEDYVGAYRTF